MPREQGGKYFAKRRAITVGETDGEYTAVTSGLALGDRVIWAGHQDLYEGVPVKPTEWGPDGPVELPAGSGAAAHDHVAPLEQHEQDHTTLRPPEPRKSKPAGAKDVWACPMHPEVKSNKPGTCPKCKMDLAKQSTSPKPKPETPSEVWTCPMHPEVKSNKPGTCPDCKMALVKQRGDLR